MSKKRDQGLAHLHGRGYRRGSGTVSQKHTRDTGGYKYSRSEAHVTAQIINIINMSFSDHVKDSIYMDDGRIAITSNITTSPTLERIPKDEIFTDIIDGDEIFFVEIKHLENVTIVTSSGVATFTKDKDDSNYWYSEIK